MQLESIVCNPYYVLRYRYYYQQNKLKALKYVYYHNSQLIINNFFYIPQSKIYTKKKIEEELKKKPIKGYVYTKISFCQTSINDVLYYFSNKGYNVCVLNYINSKVCCKSYKLGLFTQEAELCRICPTLYNSLLNTKIYPFKWSKNIIYSPKILLSRDSSNYYDFNVKLTSINIISASLNNCLNKNNKKVKNIIRRMLIIPAINNCDCLIIGAWSCDECKNNPRFIANMFYKMILKYKKMYKIICIVIPKSYNYTIFYEVFKDNGLI